MADPTSGGDEIVNLILQARNLGVDKSIAEFKVLNDLLRQVEKQMSGGKSATPTQISAITKELQKAQAAAIATGKTTSNVFIDSNKTAKALNDTLGKTAKLSGLVGVPNPKNKSAVKSYREELDQLKYSLTATNVPSVAIATKNVVGLYQALKTGRNAGVATLESMNALSTGKPAAMQHVSSMQAFKLAAQSARLSLDGITKTMKSTAKEAQWTGRQMIEGITVPLAGIGLTAIRSFQQVNDELVQLKKVTEYKEDYAGLEKEMQKVATTYGLSLKSTAALFTDIAALGKSGADIGKWGDAIAKLSMVGDIEPKGAMEFFRVVNAIFASGSVQKTNEIMAQLSAVSDETSLQLKDLAAAFPEVAPVMKQMGFSAAGVASSLAGMYRRGIPATEAAHGLKFALQRLAVPTKDAAKIIDSLGFSYLNANGQIADGSKKMMVLAEQLKGMSDARKLEVAPELFGSRQSARMNSYFADIQLGNKELKDLADGIITVDKVQSDFLRGQIAAGEIKVPGQQKPQARYDKAVEQIQKDPSTALKRIKTQMQIVSYELGKTLAPAFISVSESLVKLLQFFTNSPPAFQKFVIGVGAIVAAIGPLRYVFAQMKYTVASFLDVLKLILPQMNKITAGEAYQRLLENPMRTDIIQAGSGFAVDPRMNMLNKLRRAVGLPPKVSKSVADLEKVMGSMSAAEVKAASVHTGVYGKRLTQDESLIGSNVAVSVSNDARAANEQITAIAISAVSTADAGRVKSAASVVTANSTIIASNTALMASNALLAASQVALPGTKATPMGPVIPSLGPIALPAAQAAASLPKMLSKGKAGGALSPIADVAKTTAKSAGSVSAEVQKMLDKIAKLNATGESLGGKAGESYFNKARELLKNMNQMDVKPTNAAGNMVKQTTAAQGMQKALSSTIPKMKELTSGATGASTAMELFTGSTVSAGAGAATTGGLMAGLGAALPFILIGLAALVVILPMIIMLVQDIKKHWTAMWAAIEPSVNKLKVAFNKVGEAFGKVWEAFGKLGDIARKVFGELGTGAGSGETAYVGFAKVIGNVIDFIAEFVNLIAEGITFAAGMIMHLKVAVEYIAYPIKDVIGFVVTLFRGDLVKAVQFAAATFYETQRLWLMASQNMAKSVLWMVGTIISAFASLANVMGKNPIGNGLAQAGNSINGWAKDLNFVGILDKKFRSGLGGIFGKTTKDAAAASGPEAEEAGFDLGEDVGGGFSEGVAEGAGAAADWFPDWLSQIKGNIDSQLDELRTSAVDALQKAHDESMKLFKTRVDAIDDQEKAEEKLYKTEQYMSSKREALKRREIDAENYRNNRAVALYEGRINDVRSLDLEEQKNKEDSSNTINEIEQSRAKDLLKELRDAQKEIINSEKDAKEEQYVIQKKSFEDALNLLTKYAPQTAEAYDAMLSNINSLLKTNGVDVWPGIAKSGMQRFQEAFDESSAQIRDSFFWSGENAAAEWMRGFAPPDVIAILQNKLNSGGGGGGGGGAATSGAPEGFTPEEPMMPDSEGMLDNIKKPFEAVFKGLKDNWMEILGGIVGFMTGGPLGALINVGLIKAFKGLLNFDYGTLFGTMWDIIWGGIEGGIKGIGKIGSLVLGFFTGIDYAGIGSTVLSSLVGALQFVFISLPMKLAGITAKAGSILWDWIKEAGPQIPYWIGYAMGFLIRSVIMFIPNLIGLMRTAIPALIGWISEAGSWVGEKVSGFAVSLWNAIPDFITEIPGHIADAAVAMWSWITTAVSVAAEKIGEFSVAVFNGIVDFVSKIPGWVANAAVAVWDWLFEAIKNIPSNISAFSIAVANGFMTFVSNIPGWIAGAAEAVWSFLKTAVSLAGEKLSEFWQGFRDGLGDIDEKIIEFVKEWGPKLWSWVTDAITGLGKELGKFGIALGTGLLNLPGLILSSTVNLGGSLFEWILQAIPRIPYYIGFFLGFLIRSIITIPSLIIQGLSIAVPAMFEWVVTAASMIGPKIAEFATSVWSALVTFVSEIPANMLAAATAIWDWLKEAAPKAAQKFVEFGTSVWDAINTFLGEIPAKMIGAADAVWDWILEAAPKAVQKFIDFGVAVSTEITTFVTNIPGWFAGAADAVWDWLFEAVPKAAAKWLEFNTAVIVETTKFITSIPGWLAGAADAVWDWLFEAVPKAAEKWLAFNTAVITETVKFVSNIPGWVAGAADAVWDWITTAVPKAAEKIGQFATSVWNAITGFVTAIPANIAGAADAIWDWITVAVPKAVEKIGEFEWAVINAVTGFVTALPGHIVGAADAIWDWISTAVPKAAEKIGEFGTSVWDAITGFVTSIPEKIAGAATAIWDWIGPAKDLVGEKLGEFWQGFQDGLGEMPGDIIEKVKEWVPAIFSFITGAVSGLWNAWWKFHEELFGFLGNMVTDITEKVKEWIPAIFSWILSAVDTLWDTWWLLEEKLYGFIFDVAAKIVEKVKEWIPALFSFILTAVDTLWDTWWLLQEKLLGFIFDVAAKIVEKVAEWVPAIFSWIATAITGLPDKLAGIWNTIWTFLQDLPGKITTATSGLFNGISDSFKAALNWIIDHWNKFGFKFPEMDVPFLGKIGGWVFDTPEIPLLLAQGGTMYGTGASGVTNKAQYLVGEGNSRYPEFVIPTDPSYKNRSQQLLMQAASALGQKSAMAGRSASRTSYVTPSASASGGGGEYGGGGQEVYISVDTFIGEEQWFNEMSKKYNMTVVPTQRKVAGQQKRVISSYNDRWSIK